MTSEEPYGNNATVSASITAPTPCAVTIYPTVSEVLLVHGTLIDRFGGSHGIRDMGGLESALARPQTGYYRDLIEEGAALWESLSQNHPFIDGHKRVAVTNCSRISES